MGQSIIRNFVGAYFKIDMPNKEFRKKLQEVNFFFDFDYDVDYQPKFKNFFHDKFIMAEGGLESMPILLPFNKEDNDKIVEIEYADFEEEFEFNISDFNLDLDKCIGNLKETYADEISDMKEIFGEKLKIKTGLVAYRDEIA